MSADSDSSQVEDAQAPLSVAEFSKRQVAMIERQMLSATDLADLIDLSMTGIRQLSGGSKSKSGYMILLMNCIGT